ncbi:MAG TPA: phosphoglycerate kinase [Candidatus Saccharimonadales bacterium]
MFTKKTVYDIDLNGKRVLMRADYNLPIKEDGTVGNDYRLEQSVETIRFLLDRDVKLVICSHLGRPDGKVDPKLSLKPIAARLSEHLGREVKFVGDCIGREVVDTVQAMQPREIIMLENVRFHPEEEANDDNFAQLLASLADVFVQDGFGVVHRRHASIDAITRHLPSVAGLLLHKEVNSITQIMSAPERPLLAIIGGAKIADKIEALNHFIEIADFIAVGGAMANTFLAAEGIDVSKSKFEANGVPIAKDILVQAREKAKRERFIFYVPQDGVVANKIDKTAKTRIVSWDTHVAPEVESYPKPPGEETRVVAEDEQILDIGPISGSFIAGAIQLANTVVWNGTMGVTETTAIQGPVGPFSHGTETVIEAIVGDYGHRPTSWVGGGDTVGYIEQRKLTGAFNHVSTGGAASFELMAGRKLPGVEALLDK